MLETEEDKEQSQGYEPPEWKTNKRDDRMIKSAIIGHIGRFLALPIIATIMYSDKLNRGFTAE